MNILSIETSCDETAISIIKASGDLSSPSFEVLGNETFTQIEMHKKYGGVYPTVAKREHAINLPTVLEIVLKQAGMHTPGSQIVDETKIKEIGSRWPEESINSIIELLSSTEIPDIDHIAVTTGPGLAPALWVGINFAKVLSLAWNKPIIPVNHMQGHILSILVENAKSHAGTIDFSNLQFPALALLISGSHTEHIVMTDFLSYKKLGSTRDDAVGEAFDKVARMMELEYPGGPKISKLATEGKQNDLIKLPRPMINSGDYDFSFSGIKTSVLYTIKRLKESGEWKDELKADMALEFETAVTEVLMKKTKQAIKEYEIKSLIIAGGVAANKYIRTEFQKLDTPLLLPDVSLTGDNAIMIGVAGYFELLGKTKLHSYKKGLFCRHKNADKLAADANWSL